MLNFKTIIKGKGYQEIKYVEKGRSIREDYKTAYHRIVKKIRETY